MQSPYSMEWQGAAAKPELNKCLTSDTSKELKHLAEIKDKLYEISFRLSTV